MANFKFEGEIDGLSVRQQEFVSEVLQKRGFNNETVLIQPFGKAGDNYMANMKRITVENDGEKFKMIAKVAPATGLHRAMANTKLAYSNEHIIYTEVFAKFVEMEKEADVPETERLRFATCYGSLLEEPNEIILLEDLQVSNFVMLDRMQSLTDNNVKLVLNNMAILHSLSFALRKKEPEIFAALKGKLVNVMEIIFVSEEMKMFFSQMINQLLLVVDDEKIKSLINSTVSQIENIFKKNLNIDRDSNYSVIQHGDSWTNNFMFLLEGDKQECCIIDYQQPRENSPVGDLQYMIFSCTDYSTRSRHYYEWIDYYHTQLDKCLANFGLKANFIYPRDRLDADLKRHGKLSFALSVLMTAMMTRDSAEAARMKDVMQKDDLETNMEDVMNAVQYADSDKGSMTRFKDRLEGLVKSFIEYGYL